MFEWLCRSKPTVELEWASERASEHSQTFLGPAAHLVITSSTSEADMNQAYLLGANSYIIKHSDATKLREVGQVMKQYWLGWNQNPPLMPGHLRG